MTKLDHIKKVISEEKDTLAKKYNVARIGVFGSAVRGEETEDSDIDRTGTQKCGAKGKSSFAVKAVRDKPSKAT